MAIQRGKWCRIDSRNPQARARCDYSGLLCMHSDLVRQMEFRGNSLVWTGFLVNKRFADKPNPQNLTPLLMPDPIPIKDPRPDTTVDPNPPPYPKTPASNTGADYPVLSPFDKSPYWS